MADISKTVDTLFPNVTFLLLTATAIPEILKMYVSLIHIGLTTEEITYSTSTLTVYHREIIYAAAGELQIYCLHLQY